MSPTPTEMASILLAVASVCVATVAVRRARQAEQDAKRLAELVAQQACTVCGAKSGDQHSLFLHAAHGTFDTRSKE